MRVTEIISTMPKGIFYDMIVEEYQSKEVIDVVQIKRAKYADLLTKANKNLKTNQYEVAKNLYNEILKLLEGDPYPDEYNLENDTIFGIKCCYCYSFINSFKNKNKLSKSNIKSIEMTLLLLTESYPDKIFPYYLKLLFASRKPV